jgi:putative transposase
MRFRFIEKEKANFSICRMCKVLKVSESGYYAWASRPSSQRQRDDMVFLAHIRAAYERNYSAYGRKRMTDELRDQGIVISERRVGRLMQDNDIRVIRTRKFKRTTNSNHTYNIAPNLLDGDFQATGPNQKWAGDISYLWTAEGWLYLAVILDLYSRRVIGWAVSYRLKRGLPIEALKRADNRPLGSFIILIVVRSIAPMTIGNFSKTTAFSLRCSAKEIAMITRQ